MKFEHKSGVLLHVTSLPGRYGIGDLGPEADAWLDFLASTRTRWWQVLPLVPTGEEDSPYKSFSSFAGNPLMVSPQLMHEQGLLDEQHLQERPAFTDGRVDFTLVERWKRGLFQVAFLRLNEFPSLQKDFDVFREEQSAWLEDYTLFMTIKAQQAGAEWLDWPAPLRDRKPAALKAAKKQFAATQSFYAFQQFLFFSQWRRLRQRTAELNIGIIGDLPIYVALDSADVWCNRELFELDKRGQPLRVAGVPPDMFSVTGQLWGNPVYRWDVHKRQGYKWWLARLGAALSMVDVLRLDHFRGFADYYAIPGVDDTALNGVWEPGPGADFLKVVKKKFGGLPIIAEDLGGERSPLVLDLRDRFELPGMKLLQFAFDEDLSHRFLPKNYPENCVAYTGTHDNDTAIGWFEKAPKSERKLCLKVLKSDGKHIAWDMLRTLWASRADLTVAPLQDFLELGSEARMNFPGIALGNWGWRVKKSALTPKLAARIADLNAEFNRSA
ncbi:MAG: 4-alpha-glucanotransferase [Anaerolineales bacterium]